MNARLERGEAIGLRDLLDRFSYDCLWRAEARGKRGVHHAASTCRILSSLGRPTCHPGSCGCDSSTTHNRRPHAVFAASPRPS
jgi:hypothetical protein